MENQPTAITVEATINAAVEKVWELWNTPEHVKQWNNASPDWHTPHAQNDLKEGGSFTYTMAAKDGSFSFDFEGTYTEVVPNETLAYAMSDGRKVKITFTPMGGQTKVVETFDAETENPIEMQREGWQAILNNFKSYAEARG